MDNGVIIKGKKDRLEIQLDSNIDFNTLADNLKDKIIQAKNFIGNSRQSIEFVGRQLTSEEEDYLIDIIRKNCKIYINYVFSENSVELSKHIPKNIEKPTKFYHKNLRSGNLLEFDGNIVIIGDVNPGAMIKASGSVLVIGHLNGTVYAGTDGDKIDFIGAMYLNPVQMTIGNITALGMQKEILDTNRVKKNQSFKFAKIDGEQIIIEERL